MVVRLGMSTRSDGGGGERKKSSLSSSEQGGVKSALVSGLERESEVELANEGVGDSEPRRR
jgi:hypothetical protein